MTSYITVEDLQTDSPSIEWPGTYDKLVTELIVQASRWIDKETMRKEGAYKVSTASARYYDGNGLPWIRVDEMAEAPTAVAVNENADMATYTAWSASDYFLTPYNFPPYTKLHIDSLNGTKSIFYRYPKAVKVTAKFGYSTEVPALIKRACIIQVTRWLLRAQQGYQDVGAITELAQLNYVSELDPDVKLIILQFTPEAI